MPADRLPLKMEPHALLGGLARDERVVPIAEANWYLAEEVEDGLDYRFEAGALSAATHLTADLLVDGNKTVAFRLVLQEGEDGPRFRLGFSALNQCQARLRMPLEAVGQSRWALEREGAWLKPRCGGDRVDLDKVDRMSIQVTMKSDGPARFCLTPVTATDCEPDRLAEPVLPAGPLMDELGQSALHEWPGKSGSAEEVTARLKAQAAEASRCMLPDTFSRWGGCKDVRFEATGFFRRHHDGNRWWLVDPEGYAFWSTGLDCIGTNTDGAYAGLETALQWMPNKTGEYAAAHSDGHGAGPDIDFVKVNFLRAFGKSEWYGKWAEVALSMLRRFGFNTVANWSDWQIAKEAGFPYVRPMDYYQGETPRVFRDFPDVFHPAFEAEAETFATQLEETADDPAFIGYFLMNEPTWGFAQQTPAAGMLYTTPECETRRALADSLRAKYGSDAGLAAAWRTDVTLAAVAEGEWRHSLTEGAEADLAAFSTVMVERLFRGLSDACRRVDPNHLNLGARYYTVPPEWALAGMSCFDVFSINGYQHRVPPALAEVSRRMNAPVMIGEWHFGSLDAGLPSSGIGHVRDQMARGQAYRVYLEDAAAKPWCVGVHWFTLYDESAIGRNDGENWQIGFLDVCNRPYEELSRAARTSHERMYEVARGRVQPYDDAPEYLPLLFF